MAGKSIALKRRIYAYPSPVNFNLLSAESVLRGVSKSSIIDTALRKYYEDMSEADRRGLLKKIK